MDYEDMCYTSAYNGEYAEDLQVDELMIANMINALKNPHILKMLSGDELNLILRVVKRHIVLKAKMSLRVQQEFVGQNKRNRL